MRPDLDQLIHHANRGAQYVSIRYAERPAETRTKPSVGRVGDSFDSAIAETIFGLLEAEVV